MELQPLILISMLGLIFLVAMLYSSVGHGGASGYIAVLTIIGLPILTIKFSSLFLNILVSSISFYHFYKAGHFRFKLFYPFAITSVPMAILGAQVSLEDHLYKKILAVCLLFPIVRLSIPNTDNFESPKKPSLIWSLVIGGILGLISGMIGIGGGIMLSPLLLMLHWANLKETAAISALFILVNSIAGFAVIYSNQGDINYQMLLLVISGLLGGFLGGFLGSKYWQVNRLRHILALVLSIAVLKLFFT